MIFECNVNTNLEINNLMDLHKLKPFIDNGTKVNHSRLAREFDVARQKLMNDPTFQHLSEDCQECYFYFEAYASHLLEHGKFLVTEHGIFKLPRWEMRWYLGLMIWRFISLILANTMSGI